MKLLNTRFLVRANLRGNPKEKPLIFLISLMVLSLLLITSFSNVFTTAKSEMESDFRSRTVEIYPNDIDINGEESRFSDELLKKIRALDHVESIEPYRGEPTNDFLLKALINEDGIEDKTFAKKIKNAEEPFVYANQLIKGEKRTIVAGRDLQPKADFTCLVPSSFYPFDRWEETGETEIMNDEGIPEPVVRQIPNLQYIDGTSLVGKTLKLKLTDYSAAVFSCIGPATDDGVGTIQSDALLKGFDLDLKIVGTYKVSPTTYGYIDGIFISGETEKAIEDKAYSLSYDMNSDNDFIKNYDDNSLRRHNLVIDSYENGEKVCDTLYEMGINTFFGEGNCYLSVPEYIRVITTLLGVVGSFFIIGTVILVLVNLIQSSFDSLRTRKSDIGLMKALGYKNKTIFKCLYLEHLIITLRGFLIGFVLSSVAVLMSNLKNTHSVFDDRMYIIPLENYIVTSIIVLVFLLFVPLICQLIGLNKLNKIQPREAMG